MKENPSILKFKIQEDFGVKARVDKHNLRDGPLISELKKIIFQKTLLHIPRIKFSCEEFLEFAKCFGHAAILNDIFDSHNQDPRSPEVIRVSYPCEISLELGWHSDLCQYKNRPITFLYAVKASGESPRTDFLSLSCAYKENIQFLEKYRDLIVQTRTPYETKENRKNYSWNLLREHPLNGKDIVDINDLLFDKFQGFSREESLRVKNLIMKTITRTITYRHKWEEGDLLIFENWGQIHMRSAKKPCGYRTLFRTSIF